MAESAQGAWPVFEFTHQDAYELLCKYFTKEVMDEMCKKLTVPPMQSTLRVNTIRHTREALIPKIEQYIHETYGQDGSDMFKVSAHSALHDLIVITNSGPHPAERKYQEVAVDVRCGEALLRGADLFAVGVMAADALIQADDKVSLVIDIDGTARKGQSTRLTGSTIFLGNGTSVYNRKDLVKTTVGVGVKNDGCIYRCPSLNALCEDGSLFAQNLPSMIVTHVLDPQPNEVILDMCAAPGGKTTHIAQLMQGKGTVIACEKSKNRQAKMKALVESMGLSEIIYVQRANATNCVVVEKGKKVCIGAGGLGKVNKKSQKQKQQQQKVGGKGNAKKDPADKSGKNTDSEPRNNNGALGRAAKRKKEKISDARRESEQDRKKTKTETEASDSGKGEQKEKLPQKNTRQTETKTSASTQSSAPASSSVSPLVSSAPAPAPVSASASIRLTSPFPAESFDRVLLDPPCSGLGLRPRFKSDHKAFQLIDYANYQRKLIQQAAMAVKVGGVLVYSTCTISPLENEINVKWALTNIPSLELIAPPSHLRVGEPGMRVDYVPDGGLPGLNDQERVLVQRFNPSGSSTSDMDTNGFFVAKFIKTKSVFE